MPEVHRQERLREWQSYGAIVPVSMLGVGMTTIHVYSQGVFMLALERDLGWSRAQFAAGPTLYSMIAPFAVMAAGVLADRVGPRRVALPGSIAFCLCLAALSLTSGAAWQWYLGWVLLALTYPLINPTIWTSAVASRFTVARGLAMALTLSGTGIGSFATPILVNFLIEHHGWRLAYVMLPGIWLAVVLPASFFLFFSAGDRATTGGTAFQPTAYPILPGVDLKTGFRSTHLLRLALACFAFTFALLSMMVQFVPIVVAGGLDRDSSAAIAAVIGLASIVGRITTGSLLDRFHGPYIGGIALLVPLLAIAVLLHNDGSMSMAAIAAATIGLSLGAELDIIAYLVTRYLGVRHFGAYFGTIMGLASLATGAGSLTASLIYDHTHSYTMLFWLIAPLFILSAGLVASLGRYPTIFEPARVARRAESRIDRLP